MLYDVCCIYRCAIDSMQSACLDEFGGENVVDRSTQETTVIQHIFGGRLQSQVSFVSTFNLIFLFAINESACLFALFLISSKFLRDLSLNMHMLQFYQMHHRVPNLNGTCRLSVLHVEGFQIAMII